MDYRPCTDTSMRYTETNWQNARTLRDHVASREIQNRPQQTVCFTNIVDENLQISPWLLQLSAEKWIWKRIAQTYPFNFQTIGILWATAHLTGPSRYAKVTNAYGIRTYAVSGDLTFLTINNGQGKDILIYLLNGRLKIQYRCVVDRRTSSMVSLLRSSRCF